MDNTNTNEILAQKAKSGDKDALEKLISNNLGLVKSIAKRFIGRGQDFEDLVQIGSLGMMKAAYGYDSSFGTVFSTYAVHMITGEIKRFLRDDGIIKVSRDIKKRGYIIFRATEEFACKNNREPTVSELEKITGLSREDILTALEASAPAVSLQEKINDDEKTTMEEFIGTDPSSEITEKIALKEALVKLSCDEQTLIYLRYFKGMTQSESAKRLGMTQVKVSRKEKKIIEKLRSEMAV